MEVPTRPSIDISGRWTTAWASRKSLKTFTIAALFAVAFSLFLLSGKQRTIGQANGCDFPAIFNFGDSNSDKGGKSAAFHRIPLPNGNSFFQKPAGRCCNGKVIIDFIAEKLGLPYLSAYLDSIGTNFQHGANFATGGSIIQPLDARMFKLGYSPITLDIQVSQFEQFKDRVNELYKEGVNSDIKRKLPRPEDFSQALYIFEVGQNDLDGAFKSMTEKQVVESIPGIISQFAQAVKRLHQQGAGTFWIHNTGPIGCLPFQVLEYPPQTDNVDQNGCIRSRNEVAQEFNRQLKERVIQLRMQFPDAAMTYVDIYSAKYSLISDAKKHGFANALRYCCGHYRDNLCWRKKVVNGTEILGTSCRNTSAYISWDGIHYSHAANLWVANKVLDGLLSDPPTPITEACLMPLHL
ncbi:GDSL esterase/lipase At5g14450-like isoform X1 [Durio zibethinus]|uniref:GDSL esterase/lipase At5g14450-like isoform X1 n=1 Tax=Durio zibethinus TaxID=66656 RepID=A0A6P6BGH1_DURZI|nr:GDSL esterase/lipase At5g14450-like isoform X1 [Durio zibethinus]